MTVKQFKDTNETEYAIFMSEGDYLPIPGSLSVKDAAEIAEISPHLIRVEYEFDAAGITFKSTKYMMTEFLYRNYETFESLPLESAGSFLGMMKMIAAMPPPPEEVPVEQPTDLLPESYDDDGEDEDAED